ncbi:MAG: hypothetical protein ACM3TT_11230 [Syntrophothermus sp.]
MKLYDIIPENLFQPLVSANRELYLDAFFVLRECYKQELMIRREDLVARFIGSLEDRMLAMQLDQDEDAEDFAQSGQNLCFVSLGGRAPWTRPESGTARGTTQWSSCWRR